MSQPHLLPPTSKLLIVSTGAGGVTDEVQAKLRAGFGDYRMVDFHPRKDFTRQMTPQATVVVAGGDGTIGYVARALAGSRRRLGILSLGTFNNFALGLGMPDDLDKAIAVLRAGKTRPVTLGRANDQPFLEAAAIGLFGAEILVGDEAKDKAFGELRKGFQGVEGARPFEYEISGDFRGRGRALSLVFTNTPSTGAQMPIGEKKPTEPYLELSVPVGSSRSDIVSRMVASAILDKHAEEDGMSIRFKTVTITTKPLVTVYADNAKAGRTPVTISAHPGALQMILP
jgi:diacylglycerol kinase family enzyme